MSHLRLNMALAWLLLAGCTGGAGSAQVADVSRHAGPVRADTTVMSPSASPRQPPAADSVLRLISEVDGEGALSYPLANGATVNFWHGVTFNVQGQTYYTGFAWISPAVPGPQQDDYPDPARQAVLAQATFVLGEDAQAPWRWEGSELAIGQFGSHGRGNAVDAHGQAQTLPLHNGDLLLAVPSLQDLPGETGRALEILHFRAALPTAVEDRRWRHLGTLQTGSDNTASCGQANPRIACRTVHGVVRFIDEPGQRFPVISVAYPDTGVEAAVEYRYDAGSRTYQPT